MDEILQRLSELRQPTWETFLHVVDIALVTFVIFRLLCLVRTTRAWRILGGIVIFVLALLVSDYLQLRTLHWLLDKATLLAPVALVILLLPELRQTLEGFARLGLWPERLPGDTVRTAAKTIEEIVAAVAEMSASRIGALIVIERGVHLDDIASNGVAVNAEVSAPLLGSIFYGGNPLHDGAVVVRGDRVMAAACRLPLSEDLRLAKEFHMRHRAGLGISEQTDSVVIIVSEERGTISLAVDGQIRRLADPIELRTALNDEIRGVADESSNRRKRRRHRREEEVAS